MSFGTIDNQLLLLFRCEDALAGNGELLENRLGDPILMNHKLIISS